MLKELIAAMLLLAPLIGCGGSDNGSSQPVAQEIPLNELHFNILPIYSGPLTCDMPRKCGDIVMVDCMSAVDGPQNYYNNVTGEVVMYCGGACLGGDLSDPMRCQACPPPEWGCVAPYQ